LSAASFLASGKVMGSGASAVTDRSLSWPEGTRAFVYPGAELPSGLKLNGPTPCKDNGVSYWQLGGPSKGRLRVNEDAENLFKLGSEFTVGLCCRAGAVHAGGYDSLLLGDDNKHWLALSGDERSLCSVDGASGNASNLTAAASSTEWCQYFLRSASDGCTNVLSVDDEGLVELGTFRHSLVGSSLRSSGWGENETHVAAIAVWDRCLSWSELSAALAPKQQDPLADPADRIVRVPPTSFRGRVMDLKGHPIENVRVAWGSGGCISDKEGYFDGIVDVVDDADAKTDVPDDGASQASGTSLFSCMSLSLECDGFAPMTSVVNEGIENSLQVTMRPVSASALIDAAVGGSVADPISGSSVTVPPNSLIYPDGSLVTGPVTLSVSVIDVTDPAGLASMPGDFSAIGVDGKEVKLQSLGAMWIGATDEEGRKLQVNSESDGVVLDLHTQAKANAEKLGVVPEMWSFDEITGKWMLEPSVMSVDGEPVPNTARPASSPIPVASSAGRRVGSAKKGKKKYYDPNEVVEGCMSPEDFMKRVAADGPKSISATVTKIGYINCDLAYHHPQRAVMLKGLVLDAERRPMPRVQLWATGRDYQGRTPDVTSEAGRFGAMIAQFSSEVDVEVIYRKPSPDNDKVEVYFEDPRSAEKLEDLLYELISCIPGQYVETHTNRWERKGGYAQKAFISWNQNRRRWENRVEERVVFCKMACGEEPGLPFGDGWSLAHDIAKNVPLPRYSRASNIFSQSFGPFRTGPPGEFVDVGELVTDA